MKCACGKKGSALLVVLGMLAFMVVSAVAFSAFMRQNRLPSSFLRQKLVSSHLVKAALALAMDEVDRAIADNPYPGVGTKASRSKIGGTGPIMNYWRNRVYMGTDGDGLDEWSSETASTFPLEGLAYLPPPLVNTVRYWSRRSPTAQWSRVGNEGMPVAQWNPMGYDAGRYAFTAVNISDYLDINRLKANVMRTSTAQGRLSLAYLFENDDHTAPGEVKPEDFDAFIKKVQEDSFKERLISIADYNLALGSGAYGDIGFQSPFFDYIENKNEQAFQGPTVRKQMFITDTWYPSTNHAQTVCLADKVNGQPFEGKQQSLDDLQKEGGTAAYKIIREKLDLVSLAALYDYVDEDSVPISLAIPTLERTPMLTGLVIKPDGFKAELEMKEEKESVQEGEKQKTSVYRTWALKSLGESAFIQIDGRAVYPFKRTSGREASAGFKADVLVKLFLSEAGEDFSKTRVESPSASMRPGAAWEADLAGFTGAGAVMTLVQRDLSLDGFVEAPKTEEEASNIQFSMRLDVPALDKMQTVYGIRYDEEKGPQDATYDVSKAPADWPLLVYRQVGKGTAVSVSDGTTLKVNMAVWVRLRDGDGRTVDLVPATVADDQDLNGFQSDPTGQLGTLLSGSKDPVIPHSTGPVLQLTLEHFKDPSGEVPQAAPQAETSELSIACDDPRYNFAPEDWYRAQGVMTDQSFWMTQARSRCNGSDHRAYDIFQFVSDVGELQSMGELQFLPYVRAYGESASPIDGAYFNASKYNGAAFDARTSVTDLANKDYAWRTHWAFGEYADQEDGLDKSPYNWGIVDTQNGVVVNPYADREELFMAGLANTPYDWSVAWEGNEYTFSEVSKYCFNGYSSSEAKVEWEELQDIGEKMRACFRNGGGWWSDDLGEENEEWEKCWRNKETFFDVSLENFHDVDRKFLYGYWRNCFANRQQLFLIFVRAEPTVLGGSSAGHSPAQLGARAVALVWREPVSSLTPESEEGPAPHRMRILFYHQFD